MSILEVDTPPAPKNINHGTSNGKKSKALYIGGAFIILIMSVLAGGAYASFKKPVSEDSKIINQAKSLIEFPHETPIIASVTEKEVANKSTFFANSQIGDKILIFKENKKAILFRPKENKIIEVGSINEERPSVSGTNTPTIPTATIIPTQQNATAESTTN